MLTEKLTVYVCVCVLLTVGRLHRHICKWGGQWKRVSEVERVLHRAGGTGELHETHADTSHMCVVLCHTCVKPRSCQTALSLLWAGTKSLTPALNLAVYKYELLMKLLLLFFCISLLDIVYKLMLRSGRVGKVGKLVHAWWCVGLQLMTL